MKSWHSKITIGLTLAAACGSLNSCALFGGGKYANQTEVETEVPASLEQGKPSTGPSPDQAATYAATSGVPVTSNLTEVPEPYPLAGQTPPLPDSKPGGASLTSLPADSSRDLIDIPKPDFGSVSVHNPRPPAEMLSVGTPTAQASPRMSLGPDTASASGKIIREKVEPLTSIAAKESEIASAPRAVKSASAEPGIPLLHSGAKLSDFYRELHGELLDSAVVSNQVPPDTTAPAPNADSLAVPPPPPADPAVPGQ